MNDYKGISESLAEAHWKYIEELLATHLVSYKRRKAIEFHYKSAFIHGYGHGVEDACNGKVKWERDDNESN